MRGATNRTRRTCWRTWDFNPRTPCGVRPGSGRAPRHADAISIHAPLAGCDYDLPRQFRIIGISIHAPLAGCDCPSTKSTRGFAHFNPRTPCGVRPCGTMLRTRSPGFQSTHPLRGATSNRPESGRSDADFNPRTPCGVRRKSNYSIAIISIDFNPRTPCGVRHYLCSIIITTSNNFNPRTPCGVRRIFVQLRELVDNLFQSTHPLRGATLCPDRAQGGWTFQSTHPLRGATVMCAGFKLGNSISIHAPLAGCDIWYSLSCVASSNFNPRTPCGVRPCTPLFLAGAEGFQSTHPLRGATAQEGFEQVYSDISIHAPLAGCDPLGFSSARMARISIHAPLAGCDVRKNQT